MVDDEQVRTSGRISAALRREALNKTTSDSENQDQQGHAAEPDSREPHSSAAPAATVADVAQEPTSYTLDRNPYVQEPLENGSSGAQLESADPVVPQFATFPARVDRPKFRPFSSKWPWFALAVIAFAAILWTAWILGRQSAQAQKTALPLPAPKFLLTKASNGQDLILKSDSAATLQQLAVDVFDGDVMRHLNLTDGFKNTGTATIAHTTGNVQMIVGGVDQSGHRFLERLGFIDADAVSRDMSLAANNKGTQPSSAEPAKINTVRSHRNRRRRSSR